MGWLSRSVSSSGTPYSVLKERIPDFKQRMIFLFLFEIYRVSDFTSTEVKLGIKPCFPGEYNLLNPSTFGKNALIRLYSNDHEIEWFQKPFDETQNGYMRESHFSETNLVFPGADPEACRGRYVGANPRSYITTIPETILIGTFLHRKLFDSISMESDEPLFDFCEWHPAVGYMWKPHDESSKKFDTDDLITKYLALFEGL